VGTSLAFALETTVMRDALLGTLSFQKRAHRQCTHDFLADLRMASARVCRGARRVRNLVEHILAYFTPKMPPFLVILAHFRTIAVAIACDCLTASCGRHLELCVEAEAELTAVARAKAWLVVEPSVPC
jgi:hypothetical protein